MKFLHFSLFPAIGKNIEWWMATVGNLPVSPSAARFASGSSISNFQSVSVFSPRSMTHTKRVIYQNISLSILYYCTEIASPTPGQMAWAMFIRWHFIFFRFIAGGIYWPPANIERGGQRQGGGVGYEIHYCIICLFFFIHAYIYSKICMYAHIHIYLNRYSYEILH